MYNAFSLCRRGHASSLCVDITPHEDPEETYPGPASSTWSDPFRSLTCSTGPTSTQRCEGHVLISPVCSPPPARLCWVDALAVSWIIGSLIGKPPAAPCWTATPKPSGGLSSLPFPSPCTPQPSALHRHLPPSQVSNDSAVVMYHTR